jgi:hypothetical protein
MLHYFSSRNHAHNLVWPEGNGRITEYLRAQVEGRLQTATTLRQIVKSANGYQLHFQNHLTGPAESVFCSADNFCCTEIHAALCLC